MMRDDQKFQKHIDDLRRIKLVLHPRHCFLGSRQIDERIPRLKRFQQAIR